VHSFVHPDVQNYPRSSPCPDFRRRRAPALVLAAACGGLFLLYLFQSRTAPFNSDGAANVLQARAIIGGNPLLRGWWTSDVSFYTTELPEYALVTAIRGVTPDVVHLCGALTYTLTVLLAVLVAKGSAGGRGTGWRGAGGRRAAVAAAIMLAPSLLGGTEVFLENPDHAGTAVPVLVLLLMLDRAGQRRYLPWAVVPLLTLAGIGDELTLVVATVPLAAVCTARVIGGRRREQDRRYERRRDAALVASAAVSAGLARAAGLALRAGGGFDLRPLAGVALAPLRTVPANANGLWQSLVLLFGANQPGPPHQAQTVAAHPVLVSLAALHVIGLVAAGAGLAAGIAAVAARRADRVTAVLVTAVLALIAAGLFSTVLRSLSNAHEVALLLPFGAALAGRTLTVLPAPARPAVSARTVVPAGTVVATALACWCAVGLAGLGYAASWPAAPPAQQAVAAWLASQHQDEGLAGYWQATATTVASGGRVVVAPIVLAAAGQAGATAEADRWESSAAWYQRGQRATFVIAVTSPTAGGGLPAAEVRARFGPPAAQHRIGQDVIMLYRYNLLARLGGTSFPGPG
jgi:hypothetical protein